MLNLNDTTFNDVVAAAKASAAGDTRWLNAIERAATELRDNPWIALDAASGHLLIASPSGNTYEANGTCQCRAFVTNRPCWHRAARQLYVRYLQAQRQVSYDKAMADIGECFA